MIKSSGITYNSKLEAPSKKSYGGIVNCHHLREDECETFKEQKMQARKKGKLKSKRIEGILTVSTLQQIF